MFRKSNVQVIALSSLLLAFSISAFADATSDARKAITAIYQKQAKALEHNDIHGAFSNMTPNFVSIDAKGRKSTADAVRQNAAPVLAAAKSLHATVTIVQFSLKHNLAVATVKASLTFQVVNPNTKKQVTVVNASVSKDTWIKAKSGWLEQRTQTISQKATADGQPIPSS